MKAYWVFLRIGALSVAVFAGLGNLSAVPPVWYGYNVNIGQSPGSSTTAIPDDATSGSNARNLTVDATSTASTVLSPSGQAMNQAWTQLQLTDPSIASVWIRAEFTCPPSSLNNTEGGPNNSPFILASDSTNYCLEGSEFTTSLSYGYGPFPVASPPNLPRINLAGSSRGSVKTPIRMGMVLNGASPAVLFNAGTIGNASTWTTVEDASIPITGFYLSQLGIFALQTASPSEQQVTFQNVYQPVEGEFFQYSSGIPAPSVSTVYGTNGDPWVIFGSSVSLNPGATYSVVSAGLNGLFEFLDDVSVPAGSAITNYTAASPNIYNTSFILGSANTFTGPGTMDLGQINAQSTNWRLVNATVTANQGGPTTQGGLPLASVIFFPESKTTIGANSTLTSVNDMELWAHSTLSGLGNLSADEGVSSNGKIAPGDGNILGTLTFSASTTLTCDTDSEIYTVVTPTSHSRLTLLAAPTLGGTLTIPVLRSPGFYLAGERFTVLSAPSFNGSFSTISTPGTGHISAFLSAELEISPTTYDIVISRWADYISTACTENERKVAALLDLSRETGCQTIQLRDGLAETVDTLPLSAFSCPCVWDQIAGLEAIGLLQSAVTTAAQLSRSVQWELWHAQDAWTLSSQDRNNARFWADGSYGQATWTSGADSLQLRSQGGYGLIGVEGTVNDRFTGGVTAHYSPARQNWLFLNSHSSLWLAGGGLYGGWSQPDHWWLDGGSWYATANGQLNYLAGTLERTPLIAGPYFDNSCSSCLQGSFSGMTASGRLEAGYRWNTSVLLQPYLALQGSWARTNEFCEEGSPEQLPLRFWDNSASETLLSPGLRINKVLESPNGHLISPELTIEINQAIGNRRNDAWVGFEGAPYFAQYEGAPLPRTMLFVSGGLQIIWNRSLSGQLRANLQKGAGFDAAGVDLQLAFTF